MSGCYVYALMDSPPPRLRVEGRTIESVRVGAIFAAAARLDSPPSVSEDALKEQHAVVTRLAADANAILPMRFGAFIDDDELRRVLLAHGETVGRALELVRGREQMTVRIFGSAERAADATIAAGDAPGTAYLRRRVSAVRIPDEAALVQRAVRTIVAAERLEGGSGRVRVTLWHLIERGTCGAYRAAVARIAPEALSLQLAVTGPWPPFAFAPDLHG